MSNNNQLKSNDSLVQGFLNSVQNFPKNHAIYVQKMFYTYQQLYCISKQLASILDKYDVENCLIYAGRSITAYAGILSSLLSGKTYVPICPSHPQERNANIINLVRNNLMIIDGESIELAVQLLDNITLEMTIIIHNIPININNLHINMLQEKYSVILCSYETNHNDEFPEFIDRPAINNYAYLMFTSGSTGVPKGVPVKHENINHYINVFINRTNPCSNDKFIQLADLTFDFSVHDCFSAWAVGACLYSVPEKNFLQLIDFINSNQITFWGSVPSVATLLNNVYHLKPNQFPSLRYSMFCGEALSEHVAYSWSIAAPNSIIENFYGPTEASVCFTGYTWQANKRNITEIVPIGRQFNGLHIMVVDNELIEVDRFTIGELLLSGPQVVDKYWQNDELTNNSFINLHDENGIKNLWYRTGDLVTFDESGNLLYKGRCDDQIQIRGSRVEKLEIELILKQAAQTELVAVLPWPHAVDGTILGVIGYIVKSNIPRNAILHYCRNKLPEYMSPTEIHYINELPYNANGKVDYKALKTMREQLGNV